MKKHWYIEQRLNEKVVRRVETNKWRKEEDFEKVKYFAPVAHKVSLVVSSEKERVIN